MNSKCLASVVLGLTIAGAAGAADAPKPLEVPVSINALMVTLVDHSAHILWDQQALQRQLTDDEWRMVEYFSIQLAGAGPLIALGGSGPEDAKWAASPQWREMAQAMSASALVAMNAAKAKDKELLSSASDTLLVACEGCHAAFKPSNPTEGITHQPDYDNLYHLLRAE